MSDRYVIREVGGITHARLLHDMNVAEPDIFPPLELRHLRSGYWWIARVHDLAVGFCGMVPMVPFPRVGYLKRAYVVPEHRGHGLQARFLMVRQHKAHQLGWIKLVTECGPGNAHSRANLEAAHFVRIEPEQRWGSRGSIYFEKTLAA